MIVVINRSRHSGLLCNFTSQTGNDIKHACVHWRLPPGCQIKNSILSPSAEIHEHLLLQGLGGHISFESTTQYRVTSLWSDRLLTLAIVQLMSTIRHLSNCGLPNSYRSLSFYFYSPFFLMLSSLLLLFVDLILFILLVFVRDSLLFQFQSD